MQPETTHLPEFPNIISLLASKFSGMPIADYLNVWIDVIFACLVILVLSILFSFVCRRLSMIPGRLQSLIEVLISSVDELICGILGPKRGRKYLPFLGTLFIYVLFMNLIGIIPFMKSATSNLSTTLALALCVFIYVTYTAIKELGFFGYIDHLAGKPRGMMLFTAIMPIMMFFLHTFSEIVRPVTLSLRLRSNVWGDDMLLALFAGWGLKGLPFLLFSMSLTLLSSIVQALVFCLLSAIYFALIFSHDEDETHTENQACKVEIKSGE